MTPEIKLTKTVQKGGCAAKLPAGTLREVLGTLHQTRPQELLVGHETMDDACLWDLGDGRLLIQTLDFFTPIIDDPFCFGAVAAANAVSDIYAMGGRPATAMTILAFPVSTIPLEVIQPLMAGALSVLNESKTVLAGGHSIDDDTLKLGFSVSGFVDKGRQWTNAGARPGDALILTKALGTGTITAALKKEAAKASWVDGAIASMMRINNVIDSLPEITIDAATIHAATIHAATDVTGFGLAGHLVQMAEASQCSFLINLESLPRLEGAVECLAAGHLTKAHGTNAHYVAGRIHWDDHLTGQESWNDAQRKIVFDPQTSGGLLLAVDKSVCETVLEQIKSAGFSAAAVIGRAVEPEDVPGGARLVFGSGL